MGIVTTFESEEQFFNHFGLPFIPPAVRRNGTEIERTEELAGLITVEDIRADLHMHTTASDGAHSIREMVEASSCERVFTYRHYGPFRLLESGQWFISGATARTN